MHSANPPAVGLSSKWFLSLYTLKEVLSSKYLKENEFLLERYQRQRICNPQTDTPAVLPAGCSSVMVRA